jgi:two-component system chemotaxis response regulator CheB
VPEGRRRIVKNGAGAVVTVGASAGGVEALTKVVAGLPADLPAAVTIVLHVSPTGSSALPEILSRSTDLPVAHARNEEELTAGHVYVARPDCHLLVRPGRLEVVRGPKENGMRPAVDPLFRSAADSYRARTVAVVLSGTRDDGAAGARAISEAGGTVIVQDPADAGFPDMPLAAIARDHPDWVLPAAEISQAVRAILSEQPSSDGRTTDDKEEEMALETSYAALDPGVFERDGAPGKLTAISCPECSGSLWEVEDEGQPRFRCRVGHAYSLETALEDQDRTLDQALWTALRALLERASLARRIQERTPGSISGARFEEMEREARANAAVIRNVLLRRDGRNDA